MGVNYSVYYAKDLFRVEDRAKERPRLNKPPSWRGFCQIKVDRAICVWINLEEFLPATSDAKQKSLPANEALYSSPAHEPELGSFRLPVNEWQGLISLEETSLKHVLSFISSCVLFHSLFLSFPLFPSISLSFSLFSCGSEDLALVNQRAFYPREAINRSGALLSTQTHFH